MTIWNGITEQGAVVPIQVDAQGRVVVSGGGGTPAEVYGAAKALGLFLANGSLVDAWNLSCTRLEMGKYRLTFTNSLPSANYMVLCTSADIAPRFTFSYSRSTTGFEIGLYSINGAFTDADFSVAVFNTAPSDVTPLILPTSTVSEVKALRAEVDKFKKGKNP